MHKKVLNLIDRRTKQLAFSNGLSETPKLMPCLAVTLECQPSRLDYRIYFRDQLGARKFQDIQKVCQQIDGSVYNSVIVGRRCACRAGVGKCRPFCYRCLRLKLNMHMSGPKLTIKYCRLNDWNRRCGLSKCGISISRPVSHGNRNRSDEE